MADQTDIAKFLLSRNADMNVPVGKEQGSTVLHIALNRGQYQMFKLLIGECHNKYIKLPEPCSRNSAEYCYTEWLG